MKSVSYVKSRTVAAILIFVLLLQVLAGCSNDTTNELEWSSMQNNHPDTAFLKNPIDIALPPDITGSLNRDNIVIIDDIIYTTAMIFTINVFTNATSEREIEATISRVFSFDLQTTELTELPSFTPVMDNN